MADIKTFLVDGGMGGCGKSLAVRGIADMYQHGADDGYLSIVDHNIPRCKVLSGTPVMNPTPIPVTSDGVG